MQNKIIIYFICSYLWLELINIVSGVSTISSRVVTKLLVWVEVTCCKSSVKFKKNFKVKKSFNPQKNLKISLTLQAFILEARLIALEPLKRPSRYFLCAKKYFFIYSRSFCFFSSLGFLYLSGTFFRLLSFSSSERFWYLSRAFF